MSVERDEVIFKEPILKQSNVKARISFAEPAEWTPKPETRDASAEPLEEKYKVCKLTVILTDLDNVKTENPDALAKTIIEDQFNVQKYPYVNAKSGKLTWLNRGKLFDLETAFGFEPCYVDKQDNPVPAFVTRSGNKSAPKGEGIARVLNPDFLSAYFHPDMTVNPTNWINKDILIDVDVETSEKYGNKNVIKRYKKVETI